MDRKKAIVVLMGCLALQLCPACKTGEQDRQVRQERPGGEQVEATPVIYETDMTLDVDDVGALAVLHGMQNEGDVDLLGVSYNEVHPQAVNVIDAINTYYGRGAIPVGIYRKELASPDPSDYFSQEYSYDVDNMPHDPFDNMVAESLGLYKYLLKNQKDNSVVIISVGFLNNLYDLLNDPEGYELVRTKVKLLAVMGGLENDGFNFVRHELCSQTEYVLENWPGTLVTTHAGSDMITGETLTETTPVNNPVRRAFELEWHQGPGIGRCSWDEITVLYAVHGSRYFEVDWEGSGTLPNGYTWQFSRDHRGFADPVNPEEVENEIERLMTLPPVE